MCVDFFSIRKVRSRPLENARTPSHIIVKGSPCSLRKTSGVCSTHDQVLLLGSKTLWRNYLKCCNTSQNRYVFQNQLGRNCFFCCFLPKHVLYFGGPYVTFWFLSSRTCTEPKQPTLVIFLAGDAFLGDWYLNMPRNQQKAIEIYGKAPKIFMLTAPSLPQVVFSSRFWGTQKLGIWKTRDSKTTRIQQIKIPTKQWSNLHHWKKLPKNHPWDERYIYRSMNGLMFIFLHGFL